MTTELRALIVRQLAAALAEAWKREAEKAAKTA